MTLADLQTQVEAFVQAHGLTTSVEARMLDMVAEVGEVAKEVLKGSEYGKLPFVPPHGWTDELGDTLFTLICLANSTQVDLNAALVNVLAKYERRLGEQGDAGSGR